MASSGRGEARRAGFFRVAVEHGPNPGGISMPTTMSMPSRRRRARPEDRRQGCASARIDKVERDAEDAGHVAEEEVLFSPVDEGHRPCRCEVAAGGWSCSNVPGHHASGTNKKEEQEPLVPVTSLRPGVVPGEGGGGERARRALRRSRRIVRRRSGGAVRLSGAPRGCVPGGPRAAQFGGIVPRTIPMAMPPSGIGQSPLLPAGRARGLHEAGLVEEARDRAAVRWDRPA